MDLSKLEKGVKREGIEHLIGLLDFEDVILPALDIEPSNWHGDWVNASCPNWLGMHEGEDGSPSFGINTANLRYNCFVCGSGSLHELVAELEGISEEEAIEWLEEHSTLKHVDTTDNHVKMIEKIHSRLLDKDDALPEYPPELLFQYNKIHPYIYERGISREVVIEMQIGFGEDHMGLVIPHFYRKKLVGIVHRHLAYDGTLYYCPNEYCNPPHKKKVPKYKNSSEFPGNTTVFNYDGAIALGLPWVIVVEAPMTALYLKSHGFPSVVATFGAGLSMAQARILTDWETVYLWPDNDPAGTLWFERQVDKRGTMKPSESLALLSNYALLNIVPLVPGEKSDPADVPPELLQGYLDDAYPAALYKALGLTVKGDSNVNA